LLGLAFWGGTHLAGAPIAHLRQLTYHHAILQNARFAPDGQSFVFTLAGLGEAQDYYLGRLDGVGARPLAMPPTSHLLALSRLGDMALLVKRPGDAEGTLCRAPLTGGAPREIQEGVRSADWSPDGQELAVLKVAADGHLQVEYPLGTVVYEVPTMHLVERIRVSPTGDRVAFAEHAGLGRGFLSVVDRKGRRTVVVEGKCDSVLWSPSGDELVYTVRPGEDRLEIRATTLSGRQRLLHAIPGWAELLDMSSTGQILLGHSLKRETMALRREDAPEEDLSWLQSTEVADLSRDGRTVLFGETREGAGPGGMYVRRIGEKDATRLGDGDPLALSPDGRWAVAKLIGQPVDLLMVPTGSGRPRRVSTGGVAADWVLFATPTRLVLGGAKLGSTDFRVYVLDLEGGPLRTLPTAVPREAYAVVSLDGQSLALAPVPGGLLLLPLDGRPGRLVQGLSPAFTPIHWTTQPDQIFVGDLSALPARICRFNLLTGHLQEDSRIALTPGSDVRRITYLSLTPDGKTLVYSYGVTLTSDLFLMEGWR
jgi:dipeptidyl aminopeptidase/acylaminoacyl peptidase